MRETVGAGRVFCILLCVLFGIVGACRAPRWWAVANRGDCDPSARNILVKDPLWNSTFGQNLALRGCLRLQGGKSADENRAMLVEIQSDGRVLAQGTSPSFDASPVFEVPIAIQEHHRLELFVFGSTLQQSEAKQQTICQQEMLQTNYQCSSRSQGECWFFWSFRPTFSPQPPPETPNPPQLSCTLITRDQSQEVTPQEKPPQEKPPQEQPSSTKDGGPPGDSATPPEPPPDSSASGCTSSVAKITSPADLAGISECTEVAFMLIESTTGPDEISLPQLSKISSYLSIAPNSKIKRLLLPNLQEISAYLEVRNNPSIEVFSLPRLTRVGSYAAINQNSALKRIEMGQLQNISSFFEVIGNPLLLSLDVTRLTKVGDYISINGNPNLCLDSKVNFSQIATSWTNIANNKKSCP